MAADRQVPTTGAGSTAWADHNVEFGKLYDISCMRLINIAGTADAITADPEVPLTGSLVDGMKFMLTPGSNNTIAGVTLKVPTSGGTAEPVVDRDGNALAIGQLKAGRRHLLEWDATLTKYRVITNIEPTPVAAVPLPCFRNILANGGCELFQRGAGDSASIAQAASTTAYTADRWYYITGATQASVVSAQNGLANQSRHAARVQRNSGQTGATALIFAYPLTTEECIRLRGQKIALQFLARAGLNFSPTSGTLSYNVYFGTGTEGKRGAGFTGETNPITGSVNLTADGSTISTVAVNSGATTVATSVTQGEVKFSWTPAAGTAGANDYVEFDNVQLEASAASTAFEYLPFDVMLRELQRHYCKSFVYGTAPAQNAGLLNTLASFTPGGLDGASVGIGLVYEWRFPMQMRTTPTIVTFNPSVANANWRQTTGGGGGGAADSTVTVSPDTSTGADGVAIAGAGLNNNQSRAYIHATADASL